MLFSSRICHNVMSYVYSDMWTWLLLQWYKSLLRSLFPWNLPGSVRSKVMCAMWRGQYNIVSSSYQCKWLLQWVLHQSINKNNCWSCNAWIYFECVPEITLTWDMVSFICIIFFTWSWFDMVTIVIIVFFMMEETVPFEMHTPN